MALATFVVAATVAVLVTPLAGAFARRHGIVDRPGPLKTHSVAVPYLGGVAVFVAVAPFLAAEAPRMLLPAGCALVLGVVDDVSDLTARSRLGCEVILAIAAGLLLPAPGAVGFAVTAVAVLALLNAVNLLDGMDGLAPAVGVASALGFAALGGDGVVPSLALAGALAGFFLWNRAPARIYLGDGGAYFVGTMLALLLVLALRSDDATSTWLAVPWMVMVPVVDTAAAILRRLRTRRPIFAGDRSHIYDQLADRGLSVPRVVAVMVAAQLACVGLGLGIEALG